MSPTYIQPRPRSFKRIRPEKVLLLCNYNPKGISTVLENIGFLQLFSTLSIDIYNFHGNTAPFQLNWNFPLNNYDVIVFHNTVTYNIESISKIDERLKQKLHEYEGLKVIFKQDEQYRAFSAAEFIGKIKADLVFSCLPETEYQKVYPKEITGNIDFVLMLTGYVTPKMRLFSYSQLKNRPIDVGYRGSLQPIYFGSLAFEKRKIGDDFLKKSLNTKIQTDISSNWHDRISGEKWFDFLASCKATLGAESGASIFDLNGDVEKVYRKITQKIGEDIQDREWCERVLKLLAEFEGKIRYNQISPRHFEGAATRTVQFLYEGEYSNIIHPHKHYVPLRKDLSNFEEAIDVLNDESIRIEITERAFEEIILSEKYWIENFAQAFDKNIIKALTNKNSRSTNWISSIPAKTNLLLICSHKPHIDPRIGWIANNAPEGVVIHVMGINSDIDFEGESITKSDNGAIKIEIKGEGYKDSWLKSVNPSSNSLNIGAAAISFLKHSMSTPKNIFNEYLGVNDSHARHDIFRMYLTHFINVGTTLAFHGARFTNIDVIIATDLDTLMAGVILKEYFNAALIYDAHEFWPENDVSNSFWEKDYWKSLERYLLPSVDLALTVSPNLAQYMTMLYGHRFISVPNAEPFKSISKEKNSKNRLSDENTVAFIYQGNYAIGRGLEILIKVWPKTNTRSYLFMRGPHNQYETSLIELAESTGLLNKRIFFIEPVLEDQLVASAQSADVGIIPYEPLTTSHKYCCPNKLSQYCQAGIPILANNTEFISNVVNDNKLGNTVDFTNEDELIKAINFLADNRHTRREAGQRAFEYFQYNFHWEIVSKPLYKAIQEYAIKKNKPPGMNNQTILTPAESIQEKERRFSIRINLPRYMHTLAYNPEAASKIIYTITKFFWRLLPLTLRSKLQGYLK